jgi:hypothetical protein
MSVFVFLRMSRGQGLNDRRYVEEGAALLSAGRKEGLTENRSATPVHHCSPSVSPPEKLLPPKALMIANVMIAPSGAAHEKIINRLRMPA